MRPFLCSNQGVDDSLQSVSESLRFFRSQISAVFVPNLQKQCACDSASSVVEKIVILFDTCVCRPHHHNPAIMHKQRKVSATISLIPNFSILS
jgi:hypothetical protein